MVRRGDEKNHATVKHAPPMFISGISGLASVDSRNVGMWGDRAGRRGAIEG